MGCDPKKAENLKETTMLRTSIHTSSLLIISLLTPACDDTTDLHDDAGAAEDDDDGEDDDGDGEFGANARPRCVPSPCPDPPVGNTNWVGSNPVDTVTQDSWNVATQLSNGKFMRFTGASCPNTPSIYKFNATPTGELVFYKVNTGGPLPLPGAQIRGLDVQGCNFKAQFANTPAFASPTNVTIWIAHAVSFPRADTHITGYKYLMSVVGLNTDQPEINENEYPTCYDAESPDDYYLQVRPGLVLDTNTWQLTADSTKQSWVCPAGAFGHFARKNVNVADISDPVLGTTEGRAWGLYHDGAPHTDVGNPIRIHHPTIMGYDAAPDNCASSEPWWREALWSGGGILCRGINGASWSDEINRNAFSRNKDWDNDINVANVPVCNGTPSHDFQTYAQCYMNGSLRVCPPSPC
jgi:hypothetical protein